MITNQQQPQCQLNSSKCIDLSLSSDGYEVGIADGSEIRSHPSNHSLLENGTNSQQSHRQHDPQEISERKDEVGIADDSDIKARPLNHSLPLNVTSQQQSNGSNILRNPSPNDSASTEVLPDDDVVGRVSKKRPRPFNHSSSSTLTGKFQSQLQHGPPESVPERKNADPSADSHHVIVVDANDSDDDMLITDITSSHLSKKNIATVSSHAPSPPDPPPRRSGRKVKSTIVDVDGHRVLAINNYSVRGGAYVYDRPRPKKTPEKPKPKTPKSQKKSAGPRTVSSHEQARLVRVSDIKLRIAKMASREDAFMHANLRLLDPFLEEKVSLRLRSKLEDKIPQGGPAAIYIQPDAVVAPMRDYQLDGLSWMARMHENGLAMILGDEMGLGKTLQTISLLCYLKQTLRRNGPSLVVCPLSVLYSWCNELDKFAPSLKYCRLHASSPGDRDNIILTLKVEILTYDVIITTYDMLKTQSLRHLFSTQYFNYVVLDEGHIIKNRNSEISNAVRRLHSENKLILTGTPLQNNLIELWAMLNYLYPNVFTDSGPFAAAFDLVHNIVDREKLEEAHHVLNLFMLRRLKTEVEKLLPPRVETRVMCPLSSVQANITKNMLLRDLNLIIRAEEASEGNGEAKPSIGLYKNLNNLLLQLRKVANHPYLFKDAEEDINKTSLTTLVSVSGKLSVLDQLLRSLFQKGHRVVLFSQFTSMLDIIDDYCYGRNWSYCRFDGSTPRARRNFLINNFNSPDSDKFIFLMSTRSGSMGINLQTADTCILFDSDWNPQCDLQAMARVHRIGQKNTVHVYRLVAGGSVEERIVDRAQKKLFLDKMVNTSSSTRSDNDETGMSVGDIFADLKFGSQAVFGKTGRCLPTEEELEVITDRTRTEDTSIGNLQGGKSEHISEFDASTELYDHNNFEGVDFKAIREKQREETRRKTKGLHTSLNSTLDGKRRRKSRITMHATNGSGYGAPVPILASNNYDLESGEVSVFDRELQGREKTREVYCVLKRDVKRTGVHWGSQDMCQVCGDGGELLLCPRCPVTVHAHCAGVKNPKDFLCCSHHYCLKCKRGPSAAGGLLFPCQGCPASFCEDCLPANVHRILNECPRFEELGFPSTKTFCYIHCTAQCENVAMLDLGWTPDMKKKPSCPEKLDLYNAFK
uniref:Uncharacterized protein n=1 Tax=Corethron hystrix TaxID=216773 RepID=A0A7S1BKC7_9STRA|mmetsp:Transcript_29089/g.66667  ORF Transcript_29089/g.66667 Transcript_29089/m.66667 type:complete len:1149 (+) Transcript_29089:124-3570(+)